MNSAHRLAKKLVGFAQYYGQAVEQGSRIELSLSQTELGAMLQATRESVNRQMRRWVKRGVIEVDKKSITILDMDLLEAIADDLRVVKVFQSNTVLTRPLFGSVDASRSFRLCR